MSVNTDALPNNEERQQLLLRVANSIESEPEKYKQHIFAPQIDCGCLAYHVVKTHDGGIDYDFLRTRSRAGELLGMTETEERMLFFSNPLYVFGYRTRKSNVRRARPSAAEAAKTLRRMAEDGVMSWHDSDGYDVRGVNEFGEKRRGRKGVSCE